MINRLFVYGTLAPGESNEHVMEGMAGQWQPATTHGKLYKNGWGAALGYPGIVPKEDGELVNGLLFSSDDLPEHWPRLDEFEGDGYNRIIIPIALESGETIEAYVYALSEYPE